MRVVVSNTRCVFAFVYCSFFTHYFASISGFVSFVCPFSIFKRLCNPIGFDTVFFFFGVFILFQSISLSALENIASTKMMNSNIHGHK